MYVHRPAKCQNWGHHLPLRIIHFSWIVSVNHSQGAKKTQNLCYRYTTFWVPGAQERCIRRPNLGAQHAKNRQRMPMVMYDPGTRRFRAISRRFARRNWRNGAAGKPFATRARSQDDVRCSRAHSLKLILLSMILPKKLHEKTNKKINKNKAKNKNKNPALF